MTAKDWIEHALSLYDDEQVMAHYAKALAKMLLKAIELHPELEETLNEINNG